MQIPGTQWILVSGLGGSSPGSKPGPGDLYLLNAQSKQWHSIAQASLARVERNKLYGDCPAPDAAKYISHGLAIRPGRNGQHTLYAVNHGGRESVEVFSIDARGTEPVLTWTGCVTLKGGAWFNSVVPLPDNGFIVTSTYNPDDPQARVKMGSGQYAGAIFEWQPGRELTPFANAAARSDNGVEISPDGRWLYFNWFFGHAVMRVARSGDGEPVSTRLDFLPDNIRPAPDGSLLVTGQVADPKVLMAGCAKEPCLYGTRIVKLDPTTMQAKLIANIPPTPIFSDGTTALQIGDTIFVGSHQSDAIAYLQAPR